MQYVIWKKILLIDSYNITIYCVWFLRSLAT